MLTNLGEREMAVVQNAIFANFAKGLASYCCACSFFFLVAINVSYNALTGRIPSTLARLTNLGTYTVLRQDRLDALFHTPTLSLFCAPRIHGVGGEQNQWKIN